MGEWRGYQEVATWGRVYTLLLLSPFSAANRSSLRTPLRTYLR